MHQDLVKKGYLGLKWPKSYLNRVFYRIVIAIYVPTYPPIFGIKIGKIVVTYPFPIVPLDKTFVLPPITQRKKSKSLVKRPITEGNP